MERLALNNKTFIKYTLVILFLLFLMSFIGCKDSVHECFSGKRGKFWELHAYGDTCKHGNIIIHFRPDNGIDLFTRSRK